jgi:hypothetical protein
MNNWTWKQHMQDVFENLSRIAIAALLCTIFALPASAGDSEQAKRIFDRIAGVPPNAAETTDLASAMTGTNSACSGYQLHGATDASGVADLQAECAAYIAMDNKNFYNVTLKNFAAPWTNRDQSVFVTLNDYIATVIGMVRDDQAFNQLLSRDITYVGRAGAATSTPAANNNDHYAELEANNVNLRDELEFATQSSINGIPSTATAGVMTSRAASEAFFVAGTNRAMFRFTLLNHLCNDMEQMHDVSLTPDKIRQDVSRSPGGDSRLFLNNCIGCHAGMDPMAQAFAYYDYDEVTTQSLQYTPNAVQPKYYNNDLNFPPGFRTPDDDWNNYWRTGQNAYLGFDNSLPGSGQGAKSLGAELGNSHAFAACQVKKVFRAVCLRAPEDATDRAKVDEIITTFRGTGYRMKQVFADSAVHCMGQ